MAESDEGKFRGEGGGRALEPEMVQLVLKETKDLVRSLEGTAISRVSVTAGSLLIEVERSGATIVAAPVGAVGGASAATGAAPAAPGVLPIVAPLVGVFYRAGSPGAKAFVEVGDTVERGQQIGIVEAMKVMNEVASDYRGTVVEILAADGDAVQYEQPLMLIDTAGGGG